MTRGHLTLKLWCCTALNLSSFVLFFPFFFFLLADFISHSASLFQLRYIFGSNVLGDIEGKTLVDVGSRLGSVLYTVSSLLLSFFYRLPFSPLFSLSPPLSLSFSLL